MFMTFKHSVLYRIRALRKRVGLTVLYQMRNQLLPTEKPRVPYFCALLLAALLSSAVREDNNWYGQCQLIIDLVIIRFPSRPERQLIQKAGASVRYPWLMADSTVLDRPLFSANCFSTQQTLKDKYLLSPGRAQNVKLFDGWQLNME